MATVTRATFAPASYPTQVDLLIEEGAKGEAGSVRIRARFPIAQQGVQKHSLLVLEALDRLQALIAEAREDAAQPPPHTA